MLDDRRAPRLDEDDHPVTCVQDVGAVREQHGAVADHGADHRARCRELVKRLAGQLRLGPHGEVEDKPGYTGRWSGDRAVASGYPWNAGWEVISFDNDPIVSVDALSPSDTARSLLSRLSAEAPRAAS